MRVAHSEDVTAAVIADGLSVCRMPPVAPGVGRRGRPRAKPSPPSARISWRRGIARVLSGLPSQAYGQRARNPRSLRHGFDLSPARGSESADARCHRRHPGERADRHRPGAAVRPSCAPTSRGPMDVRLKSRWRECAFRARSRSMFGFQAGSERAIGEDRNANGRHRDFEGPTFGGAHDGLTAAPGHGPRHDAGHLCRIRTVLYAFGKRATAARR
jgi:hypothetical protein